MSPIYNAAHPEVLRGPRLPGSKDESVAVSVFGHDPEVLLRYAVKLCKPLLRLCPHLKMRRAIDASCIRYEDTTPVLSRNTSHLLCSFTRTRTLRFKAIDLFMGIQNGIVLYYQEGQPKGFNFFFFAVPSPESPIP